MYSKVFAKCIAKRVMSFLNETLVLCVNQFGFRHGLSTIDAVIEYSEYLYDNIENRRHTLGLFIDYSKAFDTVNHNILLAKLDMYGFRGITLRLFRSYLEDRTQCVRIGNYYSDCSSLLTGVPQGSVLGPLLFLCYINDFPNVSPIFKTVLFADDTTVSVSGPDFVELCGVINSELVRITDWSNANKLALNADKTAALIFSNRPHDIDLNCKVRMNNTDVEYFDSHKFLGLTLDTKLKFRGHISSICGKLSKAVGIIYRVSEFLPQKSLIGLYYSLFYPYLTYCNELWGGTYGVHLNTVEMLQKRVVRVVTHSEFLAHTGGLFYSTGILKAKDLHVYLLLIYLFKNREKFSFPSSSYSTRYPNNPILNSHRLTLTEHSVHYSAAKAWHSLPAHLKDIQSLRSFKKTLKSYFLDMYVQ